jgi:hypothetical protein
MGNAPGVDGRSRFIGLGRSALRRAENIAPRAVRAATAFGDARDRRRSRRRDRRAAIDGFAIDRAISVGGRRSRPIRSHRAAPDLDSWRDCSRRFGAPSAPIARRPAEREDSRALRLTAVSIPLGQGRLHRWETVHLRQRRRVRDRPSPPNSPPPASTATTSNPCSG